MKKYILLFFILYLVIFPNNVQAVSTNKEEFPFEITNISINDEFIQINGWGMVVNKHHYDSVNSHVYELILYNSDHKLSYSSKPIYLSQTETMKYLNARQCKQDEYYKKATVCYYNYDYVGFEFKIPLKDLHIDETYESKLVINSNILGFKEETYVFYPTITPLVQVNDVIRYEVSSNLNETSLNVVNYGVFERIGPSKSSKIRQANSMCDSIHGYNRYFDKSSTYNYVYDRYLSNNTTYYKVHTSKTTSCKLGRNVTSEGNDYESWIASNYVDFEGESMKINIKDINQAPIINIINHPTITLDDIETFDFRKYIKSIDYEDGDITNKTTITNEVNMSDIGTYILNLEIVDSHGKKAQEKLNVSVIEGNKPPVIYANDITIYQYEEFDYLKNVYANDYEDGDITNKITYKGDVDTNILGKYEITYYVKDSKNKSVTKTIIVSVIKNPKEKIRFVSTNENLIYYKRDLPINWVNNINYLIEQISNPKIFYSNKFILEK